jgi:hypothetical protein
LGDAEALGHLDLRHRAGAAEFLEGHLFGEEFGGALLDGALLGDGEGLDEVLCGNCHLSKYTF